MLLTASKDAQTQFGRLLKRSDMLKGHGSWVTAASFSPYGTRMVTASSDGEVRLWRTSFGLPEEEVYAAAFSPDGRRLALTSTDGRVRLWDAETGQAGGIGRGHTAAVWSMAFSPNGRRLASASDDQTVRRWDAETGQPIGEPLKGHTAAVQSVAFSPNGRRLASASADGEIRLWETRDDSRAGLKALEVLKKCQEQQLEQPAAVQSVAFSPDGRRLASAGGAGRGEVCLWKWDAETGQPIGEPLKGHTAAVQSVAFSPNGRRLASASADGEIRLWDAETGEVRGAGRGHMEAVQSVAFSPKGRRLTWASADGEIRLWEIRGDSRVGLKALKAIAVLKTHQGQQPGQPLVSYLKAQLSAATTGCPDPNEGPEWPDKKSDEEGKEFSKACTGSVHRKSLSAR
jgi:WD40 repeat protein